MRRIASLNNTPISRCKSLERNSKSTWKSTRQAPPGRSMKRQWLSSQPARLGPLAGGDALAELGSVATAGPTYASHDGSRHSTLVASLSPMDFKLKSAGVHERLTNVRSVTTFLSLHGADLLRWTWDPSKNRINRRAHGLSFKTAEFVFDDPLAASRTDPYRHEQRWQTIGMIGNVVVLVVHTWPEPDPVTGEKVGRIISARKATPHERKAYEEGEF